jgi:curli biogenesis system outer membrane secretion channel CsgG
MAARAVTRARPAALAATGLASILFGWVGPAHAEALRVDAQGFGATREEAIANGLAAAVEQVTGVKLEAKRTMNQVLASVSDGTRDAIHVSEQSQQDLKQTAGGVVRQYSIRTVERDASGYVAKLVVDVERFSAPGLPTQERRRVVVAPMQDLTSKGHDQLAPFYDRLVSYLVQSRRFAVLDRNHDAAYRKEIALLDSPDVPLAETIRIGQVLGADYLILPKLRAADTASESSTVRLTGDLVTRRMSRMAVDFTLVDVATRQVKWTGRFNETHDVGAEQLTNRAAASVGEQVLDAIYPIRVVQVTSDGTVVMNQGGETLQVGQLLTVNQLGDEMVDPYTREPLGRVETPVAQIAVDRVDPKLSYGRIVAGSLARTDEEMIVRKVRDEAARVALRSEAATQENKPRW